MEHGDYRNNNIGFIRLIASCMIFYEHLNHHLLRSQENAFHFNEIVFFQSIIFRPFFLSLCIFFILSGYLVTKSWDKAKCPSEFILKRILRLYPGYFFMFLVVCVCLVISFGAQILVPQTITHLAHSVLTDILVLRMDNTFNHFFINNYYETINHSLWTLIFEIMAYFITLGSGLLILKFQHIKQFHILLCIFLLIISIVFIGGVPQQHQELMPNLSGFYSMFYFGLYLVSAYVMGALYAVVNLGVKSLLRVSILGALGLIAIGFNIFFNWWGENISLLLNLIFLPPLLLYISHHVKTWFCNFERYGDYSYGIYIYHLPVIIFFIISYGVERDGFIILSALTTFILAFISWHLVEKRALDLKEKMLR